jgi:sodium/potassium-transporting ATPase subunit alpha
MLRVKGLNAISPPKKKSPWLLFLKHLAGLFNLLLIISGVLSFILFAIDPSSMVNVHSGHCELTFFV